MVYTDAPCVSTPARQAGAARSKLSKPQIEAMLEATEQAAARMDFEAILAYYAEDAVIDMELRDAGRVGRLTIGKAEYRRLLREARDQMWDYSYKRGRTDISIEPDGTRSRVEMQYTERWQDPGGAQMIQANASGWVELRDGKPKITSVHVVSTAPRPPLPASR